MTKEMGTHRRRNVISDALRYLWGASLSNAMRLPSTLKKLQINASIYQNLMLDTSGLKLSLINDSNETFIDDNQGLLP
jgi:hypothetical protein